MAQISRHGRCLVAMVKELPVLGLPDASSKRVQLMFMEDCRVMRKDTYYWRVGGQRSGGWKLCYNGAKQEQTAFEAKCTAAGYVADTSNSAYYAQRIQVTR